MMFTQLYVPTIAVCKKKLTKYISQKRIILTKSNIDIQAFFNKERLTIEYIGCRQYMVWGKKVEYIYQPCTNSYFALKNQKGTHFHQSLHENAQYVNVITFVQTYYTYTVQEIGNWTTNNASKTSRFARQRKLDCRCPF